ncbi:hypothetical protein FOCC_FOCC001566, partial [Frankliniella occidentalis]
MPVERRHGLLVPEPGRGRLRPVVVRPGRARPRRRPPLRLPGPQLGRLLADVRLPLRVQHGRAGLPARRHGAPGTQPAVRHDVQAARSAPGHVPLRHGPARLQGVPGARRADGEAEAAPDPNHLHVGAAQGAGAGLPGDALPGHLHAGGDRAQDRPDGGARAGESHPSSRIRPLIDVTRLSSLCK